MKNNAFVWSMQMRPEKTGRRCVLILLILLAAVFFLSFLLGRYRVSALQTARLLADRALSGISRGRLRLAPTWTPGGGLCCHPDPPAAHFVCCAHRRGALGCGCVVSGHVPQSHGFAGSSWRIDRRVLWCCVGNSVWRKLRCDYGGVVPLRSCGCGTDVSCRAAEPYALESGDGAGGRDGRLAVFRRNLLY